MAKPLQGKKSRILIVDDHPLCRGGLVQLINSHGDLDCCGEADSIVSARQAIERLRPDLVILDLRLGGEDATAVIKDLVLAYRDLRILVLSQKDETLFAEPCLRSGARGYIMKEEAPEELATAIRMVLGGELYVSRRLASLILKWFIDGRKGEGVAGKLSDRELQVFECIGRGVPNHEIAAQLHLSVKTVESHRENIKRKLGFRDAASLSTAAQDWVQAGEA